MAHYYSKVQDSPLNLKKIRISFKGLNLEILSGSGIFSKQGLDRGTRTLLESCIIPDKASVLDLGCGIGIVGLIIKRLHPKTDLTLSDINKRAISLSKRNLKLHNIKASVIESDLFEKIPGKFDIILSNPPMAAGKRLCQKLIEDSFLHINKGGSLQLVARHNKGGSALQEKMEGVFGSVETLAKSGGFRVYMGKKE